MTMKKQIMLNEVLEVMPTEIIIKVIKDYIIDQEMIVALIQVFKKYIFKDSYVIPPLKLPYIVKRQFHKSKKSFKYISRTPKLEYLDVQSELIDVFYVGKFSERTAQSVVKLKYINDNSVKCWPNVSHVKFKYYEVVIKHNGFSFPYIPDYDLSTFPKVISITCLGDIELELDKYYAWIYGKIRIGEILVCYYNED